jgi:hypothetical protein
VVVPRPDLCKAAVFCGTMQEGQSPWRKRLCVCTPFDDARFLVPVLTSSEQESNVNTSYRQRQRWWSFQLDGEMGVSALSPSNTLSIHPLVDPFIIPILI